MLELAILGLLKERSMHGYQLSKRLTDSLGGFWRVSYGSLYPSLKRLERQGAVEQIFDRQEVGRRKNVYRITEKGEALFKEMLEESGPESSGEDNRFRVRMAFFKYVSPVTRISTPSAKACLNAANARAPILPGMLSSSMPATRPIVRMSITCGRPRRLCTACSKAGASCFARVSNCSRS